MTPRVALAVNPTAGRGRAVTAAVAAGQALVEGGADVVAFQGASEQELRRRVREELDRGVDALVVVGGDGIVHLGVNAVAGTAVPLGIVAAGTGNDIATSLGLPVRDPVAGATAVLAALAGRDGHGVRQVDAVRCLPGGPAGPTAGDHGSGEQPRWFAGVLAAGFDAIVNERANGWRWPKGPRRYDLAIARELPVLRPRRYQLEVDGDHHEVDALLVALGNGPAYGGGMRICPDASLDDGLTDVLVVGPLSRTRFVRIYPRVYAGTHVDDPAATVLRGQRVRLSCDGIVAYADGERVGPLPLVCETVPGALRVLAPVGVAAAG